MFPESNSTGHRMPGASIITHVSDTARWVAVYRALETERPDAIFRDPFARRLAGARGAAIANAMDKRNRADWPMIVRTAVMDEIILRAVRDDGVTQVLNLAAGFDARPWRLALPPTLRWIDVDHAVMLDEKEQTLAGERTALCSILATHAGLSLAARRCLLNLWSRQDCRSDHPGADRHCDLRDDRDARLLLGAGETAEASQCNCGHPARSLLSFHSDLCGDDSDGNVGNVLCCCDELGRNARA